MKIFNLTKSLLSTPSTIVRNASYLKAKNYPTIGIENLKITTLLPNNYDHFECFKKILTSENVVFNSSWIDQWFGAKLLKKKCLQTETKIKLFEEGDDDIRLSESTIKDYRMGITPSQIAINNFFSEQGNIKKLREIYLEMTSKAEQTGLGYYKFEDQHQDLIGGGALAPLSQDAKKVDVALHILKPKQGIGSHCLEKLLEMAFKEKGVEQVWGSSIIDHPATPVICAKHGMIIRNLDGMKYYFIDKKMWEVSKDNVEKIKDYARSKRSANLEDHNHDNGRS